MSIIKISVKNYSNDNESTYSTFALSLSIVSSLTVWQSTWVPSLVQSLTGQSEFWLLVPSTYHHFPGSWTMLFNAWQDNIEHFTQFENFNNRISVTFPWIRWNKSNRNCNLENNSPLDQRNISVVEHINIDICSYSKSIPLINFNLFLGGIILRYIFFMSKSSKYIYKLMTKKKRQVC